MPLDTRIPLMSRTFDLASIDQAAQRGRLQDLQMQGIRQGMDDRRSLRELVPKAVSGDEGARAQAVGINPDLAGMFASMDERQLAQAKQRSEQVGRLAAGVLSSDNPQAAYQQARQYATQELGIPAEQMPEQYDPAFLHSAMNQSRKAEDILAQHEQTFQIKSGVGPGGQPGFYRVPVEGGPAQRVEGIQPVAKEPSAREQELQNLVSRGVPPDWAQDVVGGNVDTQMDQFGNVVAVNRATGAVRTLRGPGQQEQQAGAPIGPSPQEQRVGTPEPEAKKPGVVGVIEQGTGPVSQVQQAVSDVIGPFVDGALFPETTRAKAAIRNFNQTAKISLINSDRFPVYEQKIVAELLPDPAAFFTDPDAERAKLLQLREFLTSKQSLNEHSIESGKITLDEVGRLSNQNASIERVLGFMGTPSSGISGMTIKQLQGLDMESMTDDELTKASERWEELSRGQ